MHRWCATCSHPIHPHHAPDESKPQQIPGLPLDEPEPPVTRHLERPIGGHYSLCSALRISAARSPITTQGAMVLPVVMRGMMEPSAIRRLSIP